MIYEASKKRICQVYLDGITLAGFTEIARFAYTNKVKLNQNNMLDVLACAIKFGVERVQDYAIEYIESNIIPINVFKIIQEAKKLNIQSTEFKCYSFIEANINNKNVFKILQRSRQFHVKEIEMICYSYIEGNPEIYKDSEDFLALDWDIFSDTIKIGKLGEQAALCWAERSCINKNLEASVENMEQELGALLRWLRSSKNRKETLDKNPIESFATETISTEQERTIISSKQPIKFIVRRSYTLPGSISLKPYKEAIFKFKTDQDYIDIKEIHFCFVPTFSDEKFEISISCVNRGEFEELFHANFKVNSSNKASNKFIIPNGCKVFGSNRKVTIKIVFPNIKQRMTLELRKEISNETLSGSRIFTIIPWTDQEAQIIQRILYDCSP
jgi:hypothetical protein